MKILFAGPRHDYGDPARGGSFEFHNFLPCLAQMGPTWFFDIGRDQGLAPPELGRRLRSTMERLQPDVLFCMLGKGEIDPTTLRWAKEETETVTINWFADDHWRFDTFTRTWAPLFDHAVTTDPAALPKYAMAGLRGVLLSQWACNPLAYRPLGLPLQHDVTFVGQPHGDRRQTLQTLRARGIEVEAWGYGWPNDRLTQDGMVRMFNQSRINLNLANASAPGKATGLHRIVRGFGRILPSALVSERAREQVAGWFGRRAARRATTAAKSPVRQQIKGRNFEVPACGGFMLTEDVERLGDYYRIGKEVVAYQGLEDLVDCIRTWLADESGRLEVARAGHERTLREHTYFHRFHAVLAAAGLSPPPVAEVLASLHAPRGHAEA